MRDLSEKLTSNGVDNHFEKEQEKEKKKSERKVEGGLDKGSFCRGKHSLQQYVTEPVNSKTLRIARE